MPQPKWTPPDDATIADALARSRTIRELADALGCSPTTVYKYADQMGIDLGPLAARGGRPRRPEPPELSPEEVLEENLEVTKLKAERDHLNRQYQTALKQIQGQREIAAALAARYADPLPRPAIQVRPRRQGGSLPKREAILQISDWQLGQLVTADDTGGVNEYTWEIAEKRLERWLDAAIGEIENKRRAYDVWRVVLAISGDMVEGHDIFSGQPWSLENDAATQAMDGARMFAEALSLLMRELSPAVFDFYLVPGNHGKPGGRKAGATPTTFSFDVILYEFLKLHLKDHPVHEWGHEPAGRLLFMCAGVPILMTHGDEVRGWGGFPYYGIDKAQGRLLQEIDTIFHVWLLSHWHQAAILPSGAGHRIVNGNAVGPNRLTTAAVLGGTLPTQNLIYMSRDFGVGEVAFLALAPGEIRKPKIYGGHAA